METKHRIATSTFANTVAPSAAEHSNGPDDVEWTSNKEIAVTGVSVFPESHPPLKKAMIGWLDDWMNGLEELHD